MNTITNTIRIKSTKMRTFSGAITNTNTVTNTDANAAMKAITINVKIRSTKVRTLK